MKYIRLLLLFSITAFVMVLFLGQQNASAGQARDSDIFIDITVNGYFIKTDTHAFIEGGTTYVPIRFVSEALCVDSIDWNGDTSTVTITSNTKTICMTAREKTAYINNKPVLLDQVAKIVNDRTFVPVRFVCEALDAEVDWDGEYYIVKITKDIVVPDGVKSTKYSVDDILWLGRIIEAESSGEPLSGKVAVGNVILNRVSSDQYPDTIYGVIFDRDFGVQFEPVINGSIFNNPSSDSIVAAKKALNGVNYVGKSLFFLNPQLAESLWIPANREFFVSIANHDFYL